MNRYKLKLCSMRYRRSLILKYMDIIYHCAKDMFHDNPTDVGRIIYNQKKIKKVKPRLVKTLQVHLDSQYKEDHLKWLNEMLLKLCCTPDTYLYVVIKNIVFYPNLENYLEIPYGDQTLHVRI